MSYVELRYRYNYGQGLSVLATHGNKCADASNQASCLAAFDALDSAVGLVGQCWDDCSDFVYYAINKGDENRTAGSRDQLLSFFGAIDAPEEALSLAALDYYFWSDASKDQGAYRKVDSGYELIVKKAVSGCDPVQTDRYLLWVKADGAVEILEQEVFESESACI